MSDNIQFKIDAVLGDVSAVEQLLNQVKKGETLNIDTNQASQRIKALQQQLNQLQKTAKNIKLGGVGNTKSGSNANVGNYSNITNGATQAQQAVNGMVHQMTQVTKVGGQTVKTTQTFANETQKLVQSQTASGKATETLTTNYVKLGNALNKLGMDTGKAFDTSTVKDIESLKTVLRSADIGWNDNTHSIKNFSQQVDSAGKTITKFTTRQKSIENGVEVWKDTSYAVSTADGKLRQYGQTQNQVLNSQMNLGTMLSSAIERFAVWGIAMKAWTGVGNAISDCISYVKDLDSAMTNIRVVTMDTKEATQDLLKTYNQMGQELGASTTDIASGAVDWLRQGYSEADTTELVKSSTVLSKLALIENAEATEYLTSALKGYKLEAKDAMGVIDQMVAIDLEAATSAGDLFEAMSRTANMANTTGTQMNELAGMIATVSEVTQNSASTVGNSMKTLFSRMSNVKAGVEDFDGESLNDVEKVLNRVGIALRDNQGNWYDFYDVLGEVASRWDEFNDIQQSQITTALGGTRQRENVLVMLENWDKVQQYAQTGANSAGTAMEKYGIVLESVEAKQAQLTAKVQEFYSNVLNGGLIAGLLDVGKALMDIVNFGDSFVGKILIITTATIAWVAVLESLKKSGITGFSTLIAKILGVDIAQKTATGSAIGLKAVWDVLSAHPIVLAITAITTALMIGKTAWDKYQEHIQETIDTANELKETYTSVNQELTDNIASLSTPSDTTSYSSLADEFAQLAKGVDAYGNNISLTNSEYERYKSICQQIVGLNPDLMAGYSSETEAIGNKNHLLEQTIELLKQEQQLKAKEHLEESDTILEGAKNQYDKDIKEANKYKNSATGIKEYLSSSLSGDIDTAISAFSKDFQEKYASVFDIHEQDADKMVANYTENVAKMQEAIMQARAEVENNPDSSASVWLDTFELYAEGYIAQYKQFVDDYSRYTGDYQDAQNEFASSMDTVYQSAITSAEGYYDLNGASNRFMQNFVKGLTIGEDATPEIIDANEKAITDITNALANNSEAQVALDDFLKLDINSLNVSQYEAELQKVLSTVSGATGLDENIVKIAIEADVDTSKFEEITPLAEKLGSTFAKVGKEGKKAFKDLGTKEQKKQIKSMTDEVKDYLSTLSGSELDKVKAVLGNFTDGMGNLNTDIIGSIADLQSYVQSMNNIDNALNGVTNGFASATQAKNAFEQAMGGITEYDDNFNSYSSAVKTLQEEFDNGTVGSKKFATACKYLFGEGFDVTNVDEAYKKLQKVKGIFKEDTYGEGMLKQLKNIKSATNEAGEAFWEIKQNADGTWDFDLDTSEEGIKAMADALGITEEGVWSCMQAMQMLGGVDLFDTETIANYADQFGMLQEVATESGDTLKTINVDNLRDSLENAGISTANLDSALTQLAEQGYVLLDVGASGETLASTLNKIGLVANDGTVNVGNLIDTLSGMGYTAPQIQTVIDTLKATDEVQLGDKTVSLTLTGDADANTKLDAVKAKGDEVSANTATPTIKVEGYDTAMSQIGNVNSSMSKLNGKQAVTTIITRYKTEGSPPSGTQGIKGIGNNFSGTAHLKGTAFAHGEWGAKKTENALIGEVAPEIWVHADTGKWELVTNPQFIRVKKGDVIFNGQQTADLLNKGSSANFGASYLEGTAYINATGWGKWKKKYGVKKIKTQTGSNSTSKTKTKTKTKSGSSGGDKEWWEEELDILQENLDFSVITMDTYIEGLRVLLGQVKQGTEAWKTINKEMQEAKLDNIENQFDRGEITIDQYISKLADLRAIYKKNTEEYKELTATINEAKADKYADQYERGEISLNSYINKLATLRDSYKKNSEEWKKYNDLINETKLDALESQFDNGEISITQYINGLEKLRKNYKKNSEEYKNLTKTINETKLDNIENQFDRGEITIDEYISKLTELRKNYKKNSEDYKELTQTINEAKADKLDDQYERGEISLKSYVKQLIKLRNSYKKNSEEWKKYNDLIREANLEAYFENLAKAVEKYDQAIAELGTPRTNADAVEYAKLLSKQYKQVWKNIQHIEKELENTNLTEKERVALQEELDGYYQQEADIRDEILDTVTEYYETQREQLEQQAEYDKKTALYYKEIELYGKKGKELWEYYNNKKIEDLEQQVEARNAEKEALDEINEREELENNLLQARLNLQNALNNKTTKILTKQADGTWAYTFSANMADVKTARDEVDSAQKALDDFDWEQETKELEKQIDELNKNAEELASQYEDAEFWANREYEQTMNSIARAYGDIDALVEQWAEKYGTDINTATKAYQDVVKSNSKLEDSIVRLTRALDGYYETVGNNGTIQPKGFDTGGEVVGSGLILAHDKERVLTREQNVSFMNLLDNIKSANKLIDVSKLNIQNYQQVNTSGANDKASQTVIGNVTCNFPSITTPDGLQKAILELPRLALQKKQ